MACFSQLSRVNQQDFRIDPGFDLDMLFMPDRGAFPVMNGEAVDGDFPKGGHEIGHSAFIQLVAKPLAGSHGCAHNPGVGPYVQCFAIIVETAGQGDETPRAICFWKGPIAPAGAPSRGAGMEPDLENFGRGCFGVFFHVLDTGSGAHHLDIAGHGSSLIAETVTMRDRSLSHIGNDLDIRVRMQGKAGSRCYFIVIEDMKIAQGRVSGIAVRTDGKVMFGPEPTMILATKL